VETNLTKTVALSDIETLGCPLKPIYSVLNPAVTNLASVTFFAVQLMAQKSIGAVFLWTLIDPLLEL
jgi:hypothetical protein